MFGREKNVFRYINDVLMNMIKLNRREQNTSRSGQKECGFSSTPPYRKLRFNRHFVPCNRFSLHRELFWSVFGPFFAQNL